MDEKNKIDRVCFEETCEAILLDAAGEVSPFIESLQLNNLSLGMRIRQVCRAIDTVVEEIDRLNRYPYVYYYKDPTVLFYLFKSSRRLNCPEELEKLKKAMVLKLIYDCLLMIKMEMDIRQYVADFFSREPVDQSHGMKEPDPVPLSLNAPDAFLAGGTSATGQNQLKLAKGMEVDEKLSRITMSLNQCIGFLKLPSSLRQFVHWVRYPNTPGPEIPLNCKTNEFKYIIHHFKFFNSQLGNVVVGRCGLFISKKGIRISRTNMGSTSFKNLNTRYAIDNIFASFR